MDPEAVLQLVDKPELTEVRGRLNRVCTVVSAD